MIHRHLIYVIVVGVNLNFSRAQYNFRIAQPTSPQFALTETQNKYLLPTDRDVLEDMLLPTPLLAFKRGYVSEIHNVITSDGYILEIHRVMSTQTLKTKQQGKVAFLQHGFLDSSATWVMSGTCCGLAYLLADQGYDVWMGNARGNVYSRRHVLYDPDGSRTDRERFWAFSWHEIGIIDIPTMIDYVLGATNEEQLFYVGHSQGMTSFFVMLSERPEYNAKIKLVHALAPVAYMRHAASPVLRLVELAPAVVERTAALLGAFELLPSLDLFKLLGQQLCRANNPFLALCESVLFLIVGFDAPRLNATLFPVFLSHTPAGAGTYQLIHYIQEAQSNRFCKYDYGSPEANFAHYGTETPPDYNLKNVLVKVHIYYADNDWLSSPIDVERLYNDLPNAELHHIPDKTYNHMDFVWGSDTRSMLYDSIITSMNSYDRFATVLKKIAQPVSNYVS